MLHRGTRIWVKVLSWRERKTHTHTMAKSCRLIRLKVNDYFHTLPGFSLLCMTHTHNILLVTICKPMKLLTTGYDYWFLYKDTSYMHMTADLRRLECHHDNLKSLFSVVLFVEHTFLTWTTKLWWTPVLHNDHRKLETSSIYATENLIKKRSMATLWKTQFI